MPHGGLPRDPVHVRGEGLIPSWPETLAAYGLACVFFTILGLPLARKAGCCAPPISLAPALGWAVSTVLALPVFSLLGFSVLAVTVYAALVLAASGWVLWRMPASGPQRIPAWAVGIALVMGACPLAAIMPKTGADGILLAPPMFDHVKIALVDGILRDGLPVPNPFYGPQDPGHLAYYYLWHFGVAQFARLLHVGGWQAEAAMTGFTAFSSVMLMMGLAVALGGKRVGVIAAALLSLPGSVRPILNAAIGDDAANAFIPRSSDIGNWLNQAAWVPQHMASATCVVISALLMIRLADAGWFGAVLLGLTVAAGFESSIWVGGIAFAVAGGALGLWLLWMAPRRLQFVGRSLAACGLATVLIAPFVRDELRSLAVRHSGAGVLVAPYHVFGTLIPAGWRAVLMYPAFWLVFLPFAFPAFFPLGIAVLARPVKLRLSHASRLIPGALGLVALGCLCTAWAFQSTLDNNDLGWRAVLPALLILSPIAAVSLEALARHTSPLFFAWIAMAALGVAQALLFARDFTLGQRPGDPVGFALAERQWEEVRANAAPDERIANNPRFVQAETPWPVNISWALLADRPSCYAGWESVLAYGGVSRAQLIEIDARFTRVFAGMPQPGDLRDLTAKDNCSVVVVASTDGAWAHDPFAASKEFRFADQGMDWRIYRAVRASGADPAITAWHH